MDKRLKTRYSYICDYLFVNLLNTINGENNVATDLLEEEGVMDDWISLMEERGLLHPQQIEKVRESSIDVRKIQTFRNQCRCYFLEFQTKSNLIDSLASHTEQTPLYFDTAFRPLPSRGGTDGLISLISYDMLKAYHNGLFHKIKKCKSPTCYALFVDNNGKRKWCSMEICGNRTKARNHYAKKRAE